MTKTNIILHASNLILLMSLNIFPQEFDFFEPHTTLSGYGEIHYNYSKTSEGIISKTLDFHRFVMFFGYAWTEKWSFKSELELEHNIVDGEQGELELEQAYVNYHYADYLGFQTGVVLISAGLINEYHEPTRFFGVERPFYNNVIIPTTWFGNGLALYGNAGGFNYKFVVMEGLNSDKFSPASGIRNGRQKGFKADAENLLYNGSVDYLGISGLRFGGSYIYNDAKGDTTTNKIGLVEVHAQYRKSGFYAAFEVGSISYDSGDIEASRGYYFELAYDFGKMLEINSKIIPFFRYANINTAAETKSGSEEEKKYHYTSWMIGLSFLPIDQIAFKIDYSQKTVELGSRKTNLFNIGVGYTF